MRNTAGFPLMTALFAACTAGCLAMLWFGPGARMPHTTLVRALWLAVFGWGALSCGSSMVLYGLSEMLGTPTGAFFKPDGPGLRGLYARIALAPYRWVNWPLLLLFRLKGERPLDMITPVLGISGRLLSRDRHLLADNRIGAVIDVSGELPESSLITRNPAIDYLAVPLPDNSGPDPEDMRRCVAFARRHMDAGVPVLVHCSFGHGRSAAVCAAILLDRGDADTPENAEARMKTARPSVSLSRRQRLSVRRWRQQRTNPTTPEIASP